MKMKITLAVAVVLALVFFIWLLVEKNGSAKLTADLASARQQVSRLDRELNDNQRQLSALTSASTSEKQRLEGSVADLERRLSTAERSASSSSSSLAAARAEADRLRLEADEKVAAHSALSGELETLKASEAEARDERDKAVAARDSLREEIDHLKAAEKTYRDEIELLTHRADTAVSAGPIPEKAADQHYFQEEAARARADEGEALLLSERLKKEAEEAKAELADTAAQLAEARRANVRLTNQAGDHVSSEKMEKLRASEKAALAEVDRLKKEAARAEDELKRLRTGLDRDQTGLDDMKKELSRIIEEKEKARAEIGAVRQNYEMVIEDLKSRLGSQEMTISNLRDSLSLTFLDNVFFAEGSAAVTREGARVLNEVASALKGVPGQRIVVVGHTDDLPIAKPLRKHFPTNWELSTARSVAVVRYLEEQGGLSPNNLEAVGRGQFDPEVPNDGSDNRRRNRRVELIIRASETGK